jgi:hypothetical protein
VLSKLPNTTRYLGYFLLCIALNALIFFKPFSVFYIPDALLLIYLIYKFKDLDQEVSAIFFIGAALFFGYYFLSPEPADVYFQNKYLVSLKPFIYICILAAYSKNAPSKSLYLIVKGVVNFYPFLLIWNIALYFFKHQPPLTSLVQQSRPFFLFENNFEITFYISCFIALVFIYKDKSLKNYIYLSLVILLANSRSGLLSFLVITPFYFFTLDPKKRLIALAATVVAVLFVAHSRNITQIAGNIDRLQTLQAIWGYYNHSIFELLKVPFGYGIYQKVPTYICASLPEFAEWFVGNSNNCDPLMLQAFYTRGIYQYGIYVTLFIPLLFLLLLWREMNFRMAIIVMAPITCVATSVGGFSNGLAFLGVLLCVYAYVQVNQPVATNPAK